MATHISNVRNKPRFAYHELSPAAQEKARNEVREEFVAAADVLLQQYKSLSLNSRINSATVYSKVGFSTILRHRANIKRMNDDAYMASIIIDNLCHFLGDGTYITYFK